MKIAFLITDITTQGGTERTTVLLANTFLGNGHQVHILSLFRRNEAPLFDLNNKVNVVYLTSRNYTLSSGVLQRLRVLIQAFVSLREYCRRNKFGIIIGQAFISNFLLWLSGNAPLALACEHYKYDVYSLWVRAFRLWIYRHFRRVVVLTGNDARRYMFHKINVAVIPNMISFAPAENEGRASKRMISVGRLHFQKGYDLLLPAVVKVFEKHPDWRLDIYGEGPDRECLEKQKNTLGLDKHVFFQAFSMNIRDEYLHSSFYVMSSRFEGFPMTLLEAAACGLPIVSFTCPEGPSELLKEGGGRLVEPENIEKMTGALLEMIENEEFRNSCSVRSHAVVKEYTPERIYEKWNDVFVDLGIK